MVPHNFIHKYKYALVNKRLKYFISKKSNKQTLNIYIYIYREKNKKEHTNWENLKKRKNLNWKKNQSKRYNKKEKENKKKAQTGKNINNFSRNTPKGNKCEK